MAIGGPSGRLNPWGSGARNRAERRGYRYDCRPRAGALELVVLRMFGQSIALVFGVCWVVAAGASGGAVAEARAGVDAAEVRYVVRLPTPHTQTVEVELSFPTRGRETVDLALPAWRPGKYLILDPSGTIRSLDATDASGRALVVRKRRKSAWRIETSGVDRVRVRYTLYANSIADRTRHVDDTHAFLSGSAVFLFDPDLRDAPVSVSFPDLPAGWEIASGLAFDGDDRTTVVAPGYDVLVDSPIEAGVHRRVSFEAVGVPHEVILWGEADLDEAVIIEDFSAIIRSQQAVFGDVPFDRYVFILHCAPGLRGGTEHYNSTVCSITRESLEDPDRYERFLGLISHEYFHTWNVKRLRPAGLVPYDYVRENYTSQLWIAEGTTSYYDDLTLARTGLVTESDYLDGLSKAVDGLRNRPGASVQSLEASSFDAWIKFNKSWPDSGNSTVSFYSKGALVSLLLDLRVRSLTSDVASLDAVMRAMYERFPLDAGGFTPEDLESTVESLSGASFDAFLDAFVRGTEPLVYDDLAHVGLELYFDHETESDGDRDGPEGVASDRSPEMAPFLGVSVSSRDGLVRVERLRADGPAYHAGLMHGDLIVALDGRRVGGGGSGEWSDRVASLEVGVPVRVSFFRKNRLRELTVDVPGRAKGAWAIRRVESPTAAQRSSYEAWMHRPWPADERGEDD